MVDSGLISFAPAEGWALDSESGFVALIGPVMIKREASVLRFGLEVGQHHLNRDGQLHGGMFLAFFDHALGIVAFEAGGVARQVTIQLNTHFISGATAGSFIEIESKVSSQTYSFVFMSGRCICGTKLLATADGIWKKIRPR